MTETGPGPLATSLKELGQAMRRMRESRGLSLRDVELLQKQLPQTYGLELEFVSRPSLSRYENGQRRPSRAAANMLDQVYECQSWISLSVVGLSKHAWSPWDDDWPSEEHCYSWPLDYSGPVWIRLKPTPQEEEGVHHVRLKWGPWRWQRDLILPATGLYLMTDKGGGEVPIRVQATPHVYCQFGLRLRAGDGTFLDINHEWH
ncbi:helix-turn-helix domain-containing protein [Paenarthrobacter sp. NPDC057981]|uniref:helix-turn-helix domain-containing protein n=1 Tax=Paenarthrobacter sp. NPDC057981 TaxID=3346297 RepID=UPI0036DF4D04